MNSDTSHSKKYQLLVGIIISAICMWLAIRQTDTQQIINAFQEVNLLSIFWGMLFLTLGIIFRSARWRILGRYKFNHQLAFTKATAIGVLFNLILPARAGEVVKVLSAVKLTKESLAKILGYAIGDRLIDMIMLVIATVIVYLASPIGPLIQKWLGTLLTISILIALSIFIYIKFSKYLNKYFQAYFSKWLGSWSENIEQFLIDIRIVLSELPKNTATLSILLIAFLILIFDYSAVAMILSAFDLKLPFDAPLTLWVFLAAGSALPSAPGYIGIYQLAAVWALSYYETDPAISIAVASILQLSTLTSAALLSTLLFGKNLVKPNHI